jgi:hypothetical protein
MPPPFNGHFGPEKDVLITNPLGYPTENPSRIAYTSYPPPRMPARHDAGDTPVVRLNARLKAASDP